MTQYFLSMLIKTLPQESLTDHELYPEHPAPRMNPIHAKLVRGIVNCFDQIPGYEAIEYLDIYEAHNPKSWRQPDASVMLIPYIPEDKTLRLHEFPPPELVIEVTSESTKNTDNGVKVETYLRWGIRYYLISDLVDAKIRMINL